MSKISDTLRLHQVYNTHDILKKFGEKGKNVSVSYSPVPSGRMGMCECDHTSVYSPSFQTDPKAHWKNQGCKTFVGNRARSFSEALAWASTTYGIQEWASCPTDGRTRIPKDVLDRVKEFLKNTPLPVQEK